MGWLATAVRKLIEGIIGRPEPPRFPAPQASSPSQPAPNSSSAPRPDDLLLRMAKDLAALRDDAAKTKTDLAQFKESGINEKIQAIALLKSDKDAALGHVETVQADIAALKEQFHGQPLKFLWGLIGMISGLAHRRYAH